MGDHTSGSPARSPAQEDAFQTGFWGDSSRPGAEMRGEKEGSGQEATTQPRHSAGSRVHSVTGSPDLPQRVSYKGQLREGKKKKRLETSNSFQGEKKKKGKNISLASKKLRVFPTRLFWFYWIPLSRKTAGVEKFAGYFPSSLQPR